MHRYFISSSPDDVTYLPSFFTSIISALTDSVVVTSMLSESAFFISSSDFSISHTASGEMRTNLISSNVLSSSLFINEKSASPETSVLSAFLNIDNKSTDSPAIAIAPTQITEETHIKTISSILLVLLLIISLRIFLFRLTVHIYNSLFYVNMVEMLTVTNG